MGYAAALEAIESRGFGMKPDLTRIGALVDVLDHPERAYPSIHVAGTNGKSSTARIAAAILAAHGLATGVYSSPHLQTIRERFLITGPKGEGGGVEARYITKEEFSDAVENLLPFVELVEQKLGERITYFEFTTALSLEWMAQLPVLAGVVEVGMGGEWDSTNVVSGKVAVLTHIAVDHVKHLGPTPLDNAREKVGIIEPGAPVVSSHQDPDVLALIQDRAERHGCPLLVSGSDFRLIENALAVAGRLISVEASLASYGEIFLPLHGAHQGQNAAIAIAACEQFLGRPLDEEALREALASVESPGRMEVVRKDPLVLLDGAHNPEGAQTLAAAISETFGGRAITFVVGILHDKDIDGILEGLLPLADRVIVSTNSISRAAPPEEVGAMVKARGVDPEVVPGLVDAIDRAIETSGEDDLVVITGSLYTVGEARDYLLGSLD